MRKTYVLAILVALGSCGSPDNKSGEIQSGVAAGGQSEAELKESIREVAKEEAAREQEEKMNSTTLKFDKMVHDYGNVKPDSENTCQFKVTNTGKRPLVIENVSASCGCTTPHKPEGPIAPGESDYIEVGFHPKPGQLNEIKKIVTVVANTEPKITELQIRAFVK